MTKIAIVDDLVMMREALKAMLKTLGNSEIVFEASDSKEFMDGLTLFAPDVVIVNVRVTSKARINTYIEAKQRLANLKVIVLSVSGDEHWLRTLWHLNIDGYVQKDSDFEELAYMIKTVLKGERYFSQQLLLRYIDHNMIKDSAMFSYREKEILEYLSEGLSTGEIARKLFLSVRTIEKYRSDMLMRTGLPNSVSLVVYAMKCGILNVDLLS